MSTLRTTSLICLLAVVILCLPALVFADWVKPMDPPSDEVPDVDKDQPDLSCWLATAANVLAGAGYRDEAAAQDRAEQIYNTLMGEFDPYA